MYKPEGYLDDGIMKINLHHTACPNVAPSAREVFPFLVRRGKRTRLKLSETRNGVRAQNAQKAADPQPVRTVLVHIHTIYILHIYIYHK